MVSFLWLGFNSLKASGPLLVDSLLFTTKSPGVPGTRLIDVGRMKGWFSLATQWFWPQDPLDWKSVPEPLDHCFILSKDLFIPLSRTLEENTTKNRRRKGSSWTLIIFSSIVINSKHSPQTRYNKNVAYQMFKVSKFKVRNSEPLT